MTIPDLRPSWTECCILGCLDCIEVLVAPCIKKIIDVITCRSCRGDEASASLLTQTRGYIPVSMEDNNPYHSYDESVAPYVGVVRRSEALNTGYNTGVTQNAGSVQVYSLSNKEHFRDNFSHNRLPYSKFPQQCEISGFKRPPDIEVEGNIVEFPPESVLRHRPSNASFSSNSSSAFASSVSSERHSVAESDRNDIYDMHKMLEEINENLGGNYPREEGSISGSSTFFNSDSEYS